MRSLNKKTEMIKFILCFVFCIYQQNMIIEYMHMYVYMKLIDSSIAMPKFFGIGYYQDMWLLLASSWESDSLETCDMHMHLRKYWSVILVCSVVNPGQVATVCYHQRLCSDQPAQMNRLVWLDLSQIILKVYFVKLLPRYSWMNNANTDFTTFIILWKNFRQIKPMKVY